MMRMQWRENTHARPQARARRRSATVGPGVVSGSRSLRALVSCAASVLVLSACDGSPSAPAPAPDLTGRWVGTLDHSADPYTTRWETTLDITEFDGNAAGYVVGDLVTAYRDVFLHTGVTGNVNGATLVVRDGDRRGSSTPRTGSFWCEDREFTLDYRVSGGREQLVGRWTTPTEGCSGGTVTLVRQ